MCDLKMGDQKFASKKSEKFSTLKRVENVRPKNKRKNVPTILNDVAKDSRVCYVEAIFSSFAKG